MSVVLEERKDLLVVIRQGKVETLPKTPYTILKHLHFRGRRIIYTFNKEMKVVETYDDGIFNAHMKSGHLQIRKRDRLAEAVIEHHEKGETSNFQALFSEEYAEQNRLELIKHLVGEYRGRVRFEENLTEVDGLFAVDQHGNAYVKDDSALPADWRKLCLVAQGQLTPRYVETPIGPVRLDERGLTILAKILFLLNPNMEDSVFASQLPDWVRRRIEVNHIEKEESQNEVQEHWR
ncbi:MAG: hypothetical protein HY619_05085 [Thaumarchaeota archaeon]|nr:hypothetical protein [Nitrososphaerota archaeon]